MREGERALGAVCRQIRLQPRRLRRSRATTADLTAIAVQRHDMPGTEVETVVSASPRPGATAIDANAVEVIEVARRARREIFVVAWRGVCDRLEFAERGLVVRLEIHRRTVLVLHVAEQ